MNRSQEQDTTLETETKSPEKYVRINITKNSKGFTYETTVSLRWEGNKTAYTAILDDLNREADALARLEILKRERADDHRDSTDALLENALAAAEKAGAG